jgi:hypothetical protein
MTIWRMRIVFWIPKSTNTHLEYVIFIAFSLQQYLHERALVLLSTYLAGLVITWMLCVLCTIRTWSLVKHYV